MLFVQRELDIFVQNAETLEKQNFCEVFVETCHLYIEANFYI